MCILEKKFQAERTGNKMALSGKHACVCSMGQEVADGLQTKQRNIK